MSRSPESAGIEGSRHGGGTWFLIAVAYHLIGFAILGVAVAIL